MEALIECVPNFSEGRDMKIIGQIADAIKSVKGASILNVDPGKDTNRTVITIVGKPEAVVEGVFLGIKKASQLIDMSKHKGTHPRIGATDVCPLIPVSGISMKETSEYAKKLGARVGRELNIPVYLYEKSQADKKRSNLSVIRSGEYEGFFKKIEQAGWKPDFGPSSMNAKSGATVIGARDFLVAFNINLDTTSARLAHTIAREVRESGRTIRENDPEFNKICKNKDGKAIVIPGTLKSVKAIGWYIEEYGIAQVSMNLTNINITPVHIAFEEVCKKANEHGIQVTGSELIGLIPLKALRDAGKYFLRKQNQPSDVTETQLIQSAVKSLGLDNRGPFRPEERVIEYLLHELETSTT